MLLVVSPAGASKPHSAHCHKEHAKRYATAKAVLQMAGQFAGFGDSVAVSGNGNVIAVASPQADLKGPGLAPHGGKVYIYYGLKWSKEITLRQPGVQYDFGISVGMNFRGTEVIVGAAPACDGCAGGAAFIFSGPSYANMTRIPGTTLSTFGTSVALSGDGSTALVGSGLLDDADGACYVYQAPKFKPAHMLVTGAGCTGTSLDSTGSTLVMGLPRGNSSAAVGHYGNGAAWVYTMPGPTEHAFFRPPTVLPRPSYQVGFGESVATNKDGTMVLVGNPQYQEGTGSNGAGGAVLYCGDSYKTSIQLSVNPSSHSGTLGSSVALSRDGTTAMLGDPKDDLAYIFTGPAFNAPTAIAGTAGTDFGASVALSVDGSTAVVSSPHDGANDSYGRGTVTVYHITPLAA
jgi:hypothetical protein